MNADQKPFLAASQKQNKKQKPNQNARTAEEKKVGKP